MFYEDLLFSLGICQTMVLVCGKDMFAMCLPKLLPFLPGHTYKTIFPDPFVVSLDHATDFCQHG